MDWPEVVVLLVTYKRTDYAVRTVNALNTHLVYPNLSWHVADDGSGTKHQMAIIDAIGDEFNGRRVLTDTMQAGGTGLNRNTGLQAAFERTPYVLHIEDDWELLEKFDLCTPVRVLMENEGVGVIRFGYIEEDHLATTVPMGGSMWWKLNKKVRGFAFAGHPHLLHKRFHDTYGYYPTGLLPGATEAVFAEKVKKEGGPDILYPTWHPHGIFGHIGTVKAETLL